MLACQSAQDFSSKGNNSSINLLIVKSFCTDFPGSPGDEPHDFVSRTARRAISMALREIEMKLSDCREIWFRHLSPPQDAFNQLC